MAEETAARNAPNRVVHIPAHVFQTLRDAQLSSEKIAEILGLACEGQLCSQCPVKDTFGVINVYEDGVYIMQDCPHG